MLRGNNKRTDICWSQREKTTFLNSYGSAGRETSSSPTNGGLLGLKYTAMIYSMRRAVWTGIPQNVVPSVHSFAGSVNVYQYDLSLCASTDKIHCLGPESIRTYFFYFGIKPIAPSSNGEVLLLETMDNI